MVPASHLLEFAALAAVLVAIPGPSVLFTISRALTVGRRAALYTVAGNEVGLCVQVAAVAFGAGAGSPAHRGRPGTRRPPISRS